MKYKPYTINGVTIRSSKEYLNEERYKLGSTLRLDLYKDIAELSRLSKKPISKVLDCIVAQTLEDEQSLKSAIAKLKKY